jgi:hypothetical protein
MTVAVIASPLPLLSERKVEFKLTGIDCARWNRFRRSRVLLLGGLIVLLQIFSCPGVQVHRQLAQRQSQHPQVVFHFVPPRICKERVWLFRTSISAVTPAGAL